MFEGVPKGFRLVLMVSLVIALFVSCRTSTQAGLEGSPVHSAETADPEPALQASPRRPAQPPIAPTPRLLPTLTAPPATPASLASPAPNPTAAPATNLAPTHILTPLPVEIAIAPKQPACEDPELAVFLEDLPASDSPAYSDLIRHLCSLWQIDPSLAQIVASMPWAADGLTTTESVALGNSVSWLPSQLTWREERPSGPGSGATCPC